MDIKSSYLVDSHCHLNFNDFKDDFDSVLLRADESNVKIMVSISTAVSYTHLTLPTTPYV